MIYFLLIYKMPVSRLKNINFNHVNDPNQDITFTVPKPYSFGKGGGSVSLKYNNNLLYFQTPRMLCLYNLSMYKDDKTDKIKTINITLQFNSEADKPNRVDNFLKDISRLDNLVMATANKCHKTWLDYPRTIPIGALKALYKKTLYHKVLPDGEIDHSVPPTFKIKIPYYNEKCNFILLDENNKPRDFDLEYLQEKIVEKCYIKCIIKPKIWIVDKNFGITYEAVALQIIENNEKHKYLQNKKGKKNEENANKIENYFGKSKNDSDSEDEEDILDM